jgi:hypothetical protein
MPLSLYYIPSESSSTTTSSPIIQISNNNTTNNVVQISHPAKIDIVPLTKSTTTLQIPIQIQRIVGCMLSPSKQNTFVIVVTNSHIITSILGTRIYQVDKIDILTINDKTTTLTPQEQLADDECRELLLIALDDYKKNLFFYSDNPKQYDITNSAQRLLHDKMKPDERFIWNRSLLVDDTLFYSPFFCILIQGLISIQSNIVAIPPPPPPPGNSNNNQNSMIITLMIISRRGVNHQGTRFFVRGLDETGAAANFTETEQILIHHQQQQQSSLLYSFVQTRGSVATVWTQYPTLKYAPKVFLPSNENEGQARFSLHFYGQHSKKYYGGGKIYLINLIDRQGSSSSSQDQAKLGKRFQKHCELFPDKLDLKFEWFDFHHECKKNWDRLSVLMEDMHKPLDEIHYFGWTTRATNTGSSSFVDGEMICVQKGVVRTNCMDNLDRTNVVQSLMGRRVLLKQLAHIVVSNNSNNIGQTIKKIPPPKNVLDSGLIELEIAFKNIWGDNADAISLVYAGTNALKTDFTRTGKRTRVGLINDGKNSLMRYFLNNFYDGIRQDALDILLTTSDNNAGKDRLLLLAQRGELELSSQYVVRRVRLALLGIVLCIAIMYFIRDTLLFPFISIGMIGFVVWQLRMGGTPGGKLRELIVTKPRLRFIVNNV